MTENIHKAHRSRVKSAFLEYGLTPLNDHQILELILFYSVPQGDTNPTAHELINRFGSLRNVLEADYEDLVGVTGIGANSATLLKLMQQVAREYYTSAYSTEGTNAGDTDSIRVLCEGIFLGIKTEELHALAVSDDLKVVREERIAEGDCGSVGTSPRRIASFVIKNNCNRVILAHNHPNGVRMPSHDDVAVTKRLVSLLSALDILLDDHIIIGRNGSYSMRASSISSDIWKV